MKRFLAVSALSALLLLATACGQRGDASTAEDDGGGAATAHAAAEAARPVKAGVSHATIEHDGLERSYRLFVPTGADSGDSLPLVVGLHGGLGSGDQFAGNSQFETLAENEKFIAVFPDGIDRTWNGGNCCGQAVRKGIDDVGFLAALIEQLAAELPVDRERVFMTGHSNGGIMAFRFGCERPDLVRAIAPLAGSLEIPECKPSTGTSLLALHGDADQSHPIDGGEGPRSIAGVPFVSMEKSLQLWTSAMGCEDAPGVAKDKLLTTTTWDSCRDGVTAEFTVVAGADHPWPGGTGSRPAMQERTSTAIDATAVIWEFFKLRA